MAEKRPGEKVAAPEAKANAFASRVSRRRAPSSAGHDAGGERDGGGGEGSGGDGVGGGGDGDGGRGEWGGGGRRRMGGIAGGEMEAPGGQ